jgi:DNA-binding NtrC family response regulator
MLLADRFLVSGATGLDLATGSPVKLTRGAATASIAVFDKRRAWVVIDLVRRERSRLIVWERWGHDRLAPPVAIETVRSAILSARDGHPRAVDVVAGRADVWRRAVHDIAREAQAGGFVPIDADVLGNVLHESKDGWPTWLRDRSLVVFTCDGRLSAFATLALLKLAGRDLRPHIVIRGATSALSRPLRLIGAATMVHEAAESNPGRAAPGSDELVEDAWRLSESAGPVEVATARARWAVLLASSTEAEAVGRTALARSLITQGRHLEARPALHPLAATSELLPEDLRRRVADTQSRLEAAAVTRRTDRALVDDFLRVLEICQEIEDEPHALTRVLMVLRDRLAVEWLAFVVREADEARVVCEVGAGPRSTTSAHRALDCGQTVAPEAGVDPAEGAWLVRYGATTVGALCCRWASALPVLADDATALLTLAATATAPTLHGAVERQRPPAIGRDVPELVGESDAMRALRASVVRAARSPFPVLIEGESGSGKELVARAIHKASPRRDQRLSALNCAALTDELAEAELFGHARGAFTGALVDRPGLFEDAHGGTLFLDEVSELSGRTQAKLLRVLQEQEVRRIGEAHVRRIDTRIVSATNRPLAREVEEGRFRRDLRYRLDVIHLAVPPLRDRIEDVPALVRHVWGGLATRTGSRATLSPSAVATLGRYDWPGNVRELQNVLASLIVAAPARGSIGVRELPEVLAKVGPLAEKKPLAAARRDFEVRFVRAALARASGNAARAARDLGVTRQGFSKLVVRLGLDPRTGHDRNPVVP